MMGMRKREMEHELERRDRDTTSRAYGIHFRNFHPPSQYVFIFRTPLSFRI